MCLSYSPSVYLNDTYRAKWKRLDAFALPQDAQADSAQTLRGGVAGYASPAHLGTPSN